MRRAAIPTIALFLLISGCEGWPVRPGAYTVSTPVPSRTPSIQTATPLILSPSPSPSTTASPTDAPAVTDTPSSLTPTAVEPSLTPTSTETPTLTVTPSAAPLPVNAKILGCEPSIDIVHGMGEVTNAYVTIRNPTSADLPDLCATLSALDEGKPFPDKTKCVSSLPADYQVTFKLTVDTTFDKPTPIQIDISSNSSLLLRVGQAACSGLILVPPNITELGVPKPIP